MVHYEWIAPTIQRIQESTVNNTKALQVEASDGTASLLMVQVAYTTGNGYWQSIELKLVDNRWQGQLPAGSELRYFVQAVDQAGNVTVTTHQIFLPLTVR